MTDAELAQAIREVRDKARARAPQGPAGLEGVAAADLMPILHARDAAEAKVAAIGTVNPRPGGLANKLVQGMKRLVSRSLDWHVREQVEFNRASMACVQANMEALNAVNRELAALASHHIELRSMVNDLRAGVENAGRRVEEADAARGDFERRFEAEEIRLLRTMGELQAAYQHRLTVQEESFRESMQLQHASFTGALDRNTVEVQKRLWEDLKKVRAEFDSVIHRELRLLRQANASRQSPVASRQGPEAGRQSPDARGQGPVPEAFPIDWTHFAERFRGSPERIAAQQARYLERFRGADGEIVDIGCGRGEFLAAARDAGLRARGIELNAACVEQCRAQGLEAEHADMFAYLESVPDGSLGGSYCAQVIEHLTPANVPRLVQLLGRKLRPGALAAFETPNPGCLAIFATHFYIDPTHTRPVPAVLMRYYLEEAGFGGIEIEPFEPAEDSLPSVKELPPAFRAAFFGGLDYAIFARKL